MDSDEGLGGDFISRDCLGSNWPEKGNSCRLLKKVSGPRVQRCQPSGTLLPSPEDVRLLVVVMMR